MTEYNIEYEIMQREDKKYYLRFYLQSAKF